MINTQLPPPIASWQRNNGSGTLHRSSHTEFRPQIMSKGTRTMEKTPFPGNRACWLQYFLVMMSWPHRPYHRPAIIRASDNEAQPRLTLKVDPGFPAGSGPRRPHTWLVDRHGMGRDDRPLPVWSFPFPPNTFGVLVLADLSPLSERGPGKRRHYGKASSFGQGRGRHSTLIGGTAPPTTSDTKCVW